MRDKSQLGVSSEDGKRAPATKRPPVLLMKKRRRKKTQAMTLSHDGHAGGKNRISREIDATLSYRFEKGNEDERKSVGVVGLRRYQADDFEKKERRSGDR